MDKSNGYEQIATEFMKIRQPHIGADVVREWAQAFSANSEILELGCGHGCVTEVLIEQGLKLYAIDASPTLLSTFRERFPSVETECATVEESDYFNRTFAGVVAWGLIFLLAEDDQRKVLSKIAKALKPGGRLLFTAPSETAKWVDSMTNLESHSLGKMEYELLLHELGFSLESGQTDSGGNHYYMATKC